MKMAHQLSEPLQAPVPSDPAPLPYSAFTTREKRWILFLGAFAAMFSPMSSFIFYPAITSMAEGLGVTTGLINLAVTTYMVVSGVVPSLLGNAADKLGRRPVYIIALSLYFVANIGLALQNSFPALLVLRMVQSAGSSGKSKPRNRNSLRRRSQLTEKGRSHWDTASYPTSQAQPRGASTSGFLTLGKSS